ncbi:MAG: hypothetical protein ACE5IY_11940 [bacterium]
MYRAKASSTGDHNAGPSLLYSRRFTGVAIVSVVILFVMRSYNSFYVYNAAYFPVFKSLFNPGMFAGDIFQDSVVLKASLFYPLVRLLARLAASIGHENLLFVLFILTNLAVLLVCYRTGRLFGPKNLALLFVIVLFTQFQLLAGADVSIVYAHHFSQTAVSVVPAFLTLYWYLRRKPFLSLLALALTLAVHTKTGFAVGLVLGMVLLLDLVRPVRIRKTLLWSMALTAPLFLAIAWYFLRLSRAFAGCDELVTIMITMQGGEVDLLHPGTLQFPLLNYMLLNAAAAVIYLRYAERSEVERLAFRLLVATNLALVLGAIVSFVHYHVMPVPSLMLQAWPRIGLISTWLSLLIVSHFLLTYHAVWDEWPRVVQAIVAFLVSAIFLNTYNKKFLMLAALIVAGTFLAIHLGRFPRRRFLPVMVWGFLGLTVLHKANDLNFVLHQRIEKQWMATPYRTPYSYDPVEYNICTWLNRHARPDKMIVYPVLEAGKLQLREIRRYSERPWFVTDYLMDYFGSCAAFETWKQRRAVVEDWLATGEIAWLAENNVGYIIVKKQDRARFDLAPGASVYQSGELLVYEVDSDAFSASEGRALSQTTSTARP